MPIYEFKCRECGKQFEEIVLDESEEVVCPHCSGKNAERLLSACKFKTGGPIVQGSPSSSAVTSRGMGGCSSCSSSNCSSCGSGS